MADPVFLFRRSCGISLVEVLVACALLALILAPILFTFMTGTRGMEITKEELIGQHAGVEIAEQLATIPFECLPTGDLPDSAIVDGLAIGASSPFHFHLSQSPGTRKSVRITEDRLPGGLIVKRIRVTISLSGSGDRFQTFETVVSRHD